MQINTKRQYCAPNYKQIFTKPPFLVSKDFSIWVGCSENFHSSCLGVIVPKKNVKLAVARNKSKRIAREIFKDYRYKLVKKDVVLVIKKFETAHNLDIWKKKLIGVYSWLGYFVARC